MTPTILLTDNGYVTLSDNKYHFYYKDHEGNNRVVADQSNTVEQVNNYYPFGLSYKNDANTNVNRYKYNGKELQTQHGLDWYDYGARFYDPELCQWHSVDPACEKYYDISPYAYCGDEPIRRIDKDGRVIDVSGLTEKEKKEYKDETSMIKQYSELFKMMYSALEKTKNVIEIRFGKTIERPNDKSHNMVEGEFTANGKNGTVTFLSGNQLSSSVVSEESNIYNIDFNNKESVSNLLRGYIDAAKGYAQYNNSNMIGSEHYSERTDVDPYSLIKMIEDAYGK